MYYPNEKRGYEKIKRDIKITEEKVDRGWRKYREDKNRINQKEIDTINDKNTNPAVRDCLALGVGLTDLTGEQIKKIKIYRTKYP